MPYHLIANTISCSSIICGLLAIFSAIAGQINLAAWLIIASMVLDILDGKVARLSTIDTDFGKELDSLSDVVAFGVAPLVLLYTAFNVSRSIDWMIFFSAYGLAAALRLARFNLKTNTVATNFTGLPTTACAYFIASSVLLANRMQVIIIPVQIKIGLLVLSILMISLIPYPHDLNKKNFIWLIALVVFAVVFIINNALSLWLVAFIYVVCGPLITLNKSRSK